MSKIALITFHRSYNYGARLQAYALFHKLANMGEDTVIIRYETSIQMSQYRILQPDFSVVGILRNFRNLMSLYILRKRQACFDYFSDLNCKYSEIVIDKEQLQKLLNTYDVALVGSDQIWNIKEKAFDDAYLLPFPLKSKKISYASSTGDDIKMWTAEEIDEVSNRLKDFNYVSIRESSGKEVFTSKGISICQVVDPTLLLTKLDWDKVKSHILDPNEEYILYYTVKATKFSVEFVKYLSNVTRLKVIAIHPQNSLEFKSGFIRKIDIGPDGFIEYISKAKYVVTTSFHATVFSIIYNKRFFCPTMNDRIVDLLNKLGLSKRIVRNSADIFENDTDINWELVMYNLSILQSKSINYLENAIKE